MAQTKVELDHENRPVPVDESPDTVIKVWAVSTEPEGEYDSLIVRGYQDMLDLVRSEMESLLEHADLDDVDLKSEGVSVRVRLKQMTKAKYTHLEETA